MQLTNIQWTRFSSNPIFARLKAEPYTRGHACVMVSPGCSRCYSQDWNRQRFGTHLDFTEANLDKVEFVLNDAELLKWIRYRGEPARVFIGDMTDIFGEWVPDEWLDKIFAAVALSPKLTFQVLTKRSARMRDYIERKRGGTPCAKGPIDQYAYEFNRDILNGDRDARKWKAIPWPLPNVWLGVSVEDQRRADERIPDLLATPAAIRFLSVEPLLEEVNLQEVGLWTDALRGIRWREAPDTYSGVDCDDLPAKVDLCIIGGESGTKARPFDIAWAESIAKQCENTGVAYFFKQAGALPVIHNESKIKRVGRMNIDLGKVERSLPLLPLLLKDRKGGDLDELKAIFGDAPWLRREFPTV